MYGDGGAGGRGEVGKASLKTSEDGDEDSAGMIVTTMMISVTVIAIMLVAVLASRRQPVR